MDGSIDSKRILRLAGNLMAGCTGPSKCVMLQ
jgi:hypothetical protein